MPLFKDYMIGLSTNTPTLDDYLVFYNNGDSTEYKTQITSLPFWAWAWYNISLIGSSWSGATMTVTTARLWRIWRVGFFNIEWSVTSKWTCAGDFTIYSPETPLPAKKTLFSGGVYASWWFASRGIPYIDTASNIKFISSFPSTNLNWSAISVGDYIFISWFYEI